MCSCTYSVPNKGWCIGRLKTELISIVSFNLHMQMVLNFLKLNINRYVQKWFTKYENKKTTPVKQPTTSEGQYQEQSSLCYYVQVQPKLP